jgi:hypothetical protein
MEIIQESPIYWYVIGVIIALIGIRIAYVSYFGPSGEDRSRGFNRSHGKYRVIYNEGGRSEPMCRDVAHDYAEIFGGVVQRIEK